MVTLIVDDDSIHGQMLVEGLVEAGRQAAAATGVRDAIVLLRTGRFELVVSDIRMIDGNGFDLLRSVRAQIRPVPVILMTSFGTGATTQQALDAGAFAYLPKPFPLSALVELVTRAHASQRNQR